jgi:Ca2+-binding RTX toxin-like protein
VTINFTGSAEEKASKQKAFNVLKKNELEGDSAYAIKFAGKNSKSGWSFGWTQFDVRNNEEAKKKLTTILQNAKNSAGNYIIDDGDVTTTERKDDKKVKALVDKAAMNSSTALSTDEKTLINSALSSTLGKDTIDGVVDSEIEKLLARAGEVANAAKQEYQDFLKSDIGKLFLVDYANQYGGIDADGPLEKFLQGDDVPTGVGYVKVDGSFGVDDLLNFYFRQKYGATQNATDPIRRFGNIAAETGYTPSNAEEAKNVLRAFTFHLHKDGRYQQVKNANEQALWNFANSVLKPAQTVLVDALRSEYGSLVADAAAAVEATAIYIDPTLPGDDPDNAATLDTRASRRSDIGTNDLLIGDGGDDKLQSGKGNDCLIGGKGDDTLEGGEGEDMYVFSMDSLGRLQGKDKIKDSDGKGSIVVNGVKLDGSMAQSYVSAAFSTNPSWRVRVNGQDLFLTLVDQNLVSGRGTLHIQGVQGEPGGQITVENFKNGDLNLVLPPSDLSALVAFTPGDPHPFSNPDSPPQTQSTDADEGRLKALSFALVTPALEGQIVRISADVLLDRLGILKGDDTLSLANGYVDIALTAGQTQVIFGLVSQGDVDENTLINLSAQLLPLQDGSGGTALASLQVNLRADQEPEGPIEIVTTESVRVGPDEPDPSHNSHLFYYDVGTSNTLITLGRYTDTDLIFIRPEGDDHVIADDNDDTISFFLPDDENGNPLPIGTHGSKIFEGRGGDDYLASADGRDWLMGGSGADVIGGNGGDDLLEGGGDSDCIAGGEGRDRIFADSMIATDVAIALGESAGSAARGEFLNGNAGDDLVVGTAARDLIGGGSGANTIVAGAGDDLIEADTTFDLFTTDRGRWAADLQSTMVNGATEF